MVQTQNGQGISAGTTFSLVVPGCQNFFPICWANAFNQAGRRSSFLERAKILSCSRRRRLPIWIDFKEEAYGFPDLENRGVKIAIDRHGPPFDPDSEDRVVTAEGLIEARDLLARRLPALRDAPVVETRVCQYENTSNGDFLIDRHPRFETCGWLAAVPVTGSSTTGGG